jgi:hypothetical protein
MTRGLTQRKKGTFGDTQNPGHFDEKVVRDGTLGLAKTYVQDQMRKSKVSRKKPIEIEAHAFEVWQQG